MAKPDVVQQIFDQEDVHDIAEPVVLASLLEHLGAGVELLRDLVAQGNAVGRFGQRGLKRVQDMAFTRSSSR
jgi:hypothetical protein